MSNGKPVRIGIIGAGFARTTQIPGFQIAWARVLSLLPAGIGNTPRRRQRIQHKNVANDWRELVKRDDVDLVSVVTPPATHMEMTLAARARQGGAVRKADGDECR